MKYVLLSKNLENSHINHTNSVFYKNVILYVNRSIFASYEEAYDLFCFLGDFYGSGTQDTEVSKSLHGDYGTEGKFVSE